MNYQTTELSVHGNRLRETLIHNPHGMDIIVCTSDVTHTDSTSPYETGVFYTLDGGKHLNGEVGGYGNGAIIRSENKKQAAIGHLQGILYASKELRKERNA